MKATGEKRVNLRIWLGGSYGYHIGHFNSQGELVGTRNLGRTTFALISDAPNMLLPGFQSDSHGRRGQNVLFEDMQVRFLVSPKVSPSGGNIFTNDVGLVAPGLHRDDSVIAPSVITIILRPARWRQTPPQ